MPDLNPVSSQTQYETVCEDWDAFKASAEESRACIAELKELLQLEDPIGAELEDGFEEISKQRVSILSETSLACLVKHA